MIITREGQNKFNKKMAKNVKQNSHIIRLRSEFTVDFASHRSIFKRKSNGHNVQTLVINNVFRFRILSDVNNYD